MEGAEGKIKGGGVTPMLTHCLHIVFRDTTANGVGVTVSGFLLAMLGKSGGVTLYSAHALSRCITVIYKKIFSPGTGFDANLVDKCSVFVHSKICGIVRKQTLSKGSNRSLLQSGEKHGQSPYIN